MTTPPMRRGERGTVIIFALGFLVVLLVIAAGVHALVLGQLHGSSRLRQRIAATELAEGGLARARAWFTASAYQLPQADLLVVGVPARLRSNSDAVVLPANHPDAYKDATGQSRIGIVSGYQKVLSKQTGPVGSYDVVASLIAVQPETWEVIATATVGATQRRVGGLLVRNQQSLFQDALFGSDAVMLTGNSSTDSYDSTLGNYGGANKLASGNVGSNGDITLKGSSSVNGDARPGPNGSLIKQGNPKVTGLTDASLGARELAGVTIPAGAVSLGDVRVANNDKRTISTGTYVVGDLVVDGSGVLTIDSSGGPVTFYVTGKIAIGGNGGVNVTNNAARGFAIFQTGNGGAWVGGSGQLTAAIYAPESNLTVDGNGTLYGGFVGRSANVDGSGTVHFDQSLRAQGTGGGSLRLTAQWSPP